MRYFLILTAVLFLGACSSSGSKSDDSSSTAEKVKSSATKAASKASGKDASAATSSGDGITCKIGSTSREIAVVNSPSGCTVQYTKNGETKEVANGATGSDHCSNVAQRIQSNLENAGFSCQ